MSELTYAYYPGCSQLGTAGEYEASTRACCEALGLDLREVPDWSCCGSSPAHMVDHHLSAALAGRNLNRAATVGAKSMLTPCPSCLNVLRTARARLADPEFRSRVEALTGEPCLEGPEPRSVLQALVEDLGPGELARRVTRSLAGVRIVTYYGCLLTRPPGIMAFDDPENPVSMDRLLQAAGAEVPDFAAKQDCCGASLAVPRQDIVLKLSGGVLREAEEAGAAAIAVACPLCHMNLDLRRSQINAAAGRKYTVPVLYFTQILGLALGLPESRLGLSRLTVSPAPFLEAWQRAGEAAAKAAADKAARKTVKKAGAQAQEEVRP